MPSSLVADCLMAAMRRKIYTESNNRIGCEEAGRPERQDGNCTGEKGTFLSDINLIAHVGDRQKIVHCIEMGDQQMIFPEYPFFCNISYQT